MIDFDEAGLQRYLADDPGGPVVMLNLLRFQPESGADKFMAYIQQFESSGINAKYGLETVFGGQGFAALVAEDGQAWDLIALVRYPSRQNFVDMVHDPLYQQIKHLRREALVEAVLQPTVQIAG